MTGNGLWTFTKKTGNLGIGTTNPSYTLDVAGNIHSSGDAAFQGAYDNTQAGSANLLVQTDGTLRRATGSSKRYKENIEDSNFGLNEVMRLRPVNFDYKDEYVKNAPRQLGFIAEEVEEITPMLASYVNGQIDTVRYDLMTALLAGGIQDIATIIDLSNASTTLSARS